MHNWVEELKGEVIKPGAGPILILAALRVKEMERFTGPVPHWVHFLSQSSVSTFSQGVEVVRGMIAEEEARRYE